MPFLKSFEGFLASESLLVERPRERPNAIQVYGACFEIGDS